MYIERRKSSNKKVNYYYFKEDNGKLMVTITGCGDRIENDPKMGFCGMLIIFDEIRHVALTDCTDIRNIDEYGKRVE